jgi:hypothetical protein
MVKVLVWGVPTRSCCLLMVIAQEPTEPFATLYRFLARNYRIPRKQQDVAFALMIALSMEMLDIFAQRSPQGVLTKENHPWTSTLP